MERREHYHPEDIESLLHERGYDELLEEERAFVLRHLAGREEYEAMRTLLSQVREDDRRRPPLVADSAVRDHVMAAFRAQQRPQWSIWLNSIGAALWPKEMRAGALWRPALAIASLALLIVAGVQVVKFAEKEAAQPQLAEAKSATAKEVLNDPAPIVPDSEASPSAIIVLQDPNEQQAVTVVTTNGASAIEESSVHVAEDASVRNEAQLEELPVADNSSEAERTDTDGEMAAPEKKAEAAASAPAPVATGASHVVTVDELARNVSVAESRSRARAFNAEAAKRSEERSVGNLAAEPALLALLNTGW